MEAPRVGDQVRLIATHPDARVRGRDCIVHTVANGGLPYVLRTTFKGLTTTIQCSREEFWTHEEEESGLRHDVDLMNTLVAEANEAKLCEQEARQANKRLQLELESLRCAAKGHGLQTLKLKMTGSNKSELWSHIWKFISKAEARDKVGRIAQYFCRFLQGTVGLLPNSALAPWKSVIAEVQTTLAWARRTNRWGKEMPHIPALSEAIKNRDPLEATQRAVLITFLVQDHIYWLLKVGILRFESYTAIQWHRRNLRFITFSHVLNFFLCVRDIMRIKEKQRLKDAKYTGSPQAAQKADHEIYDNKKMMFRYVLTFIQMLHVSGVKAMDDTYIGLMGCVSSYIDASKQW